MNGTLELLQDLKVSNHELSHITWRFDSDTVLAAGFDGHLIVIDCKKD